MNALDIVLAVLSILGTVSSIAFAILAFRRNDRGDHKEAGKNEGVLISDVGYIKSSIDRIEKSIDKLVGTFCGTGVSGPSSPSSGASPNCICGPGSGCWAVCSSRRSGRR